MPTPLIIVASTRPGRVGLDELGRLPTALAPLRNA
jgi:hypothetical protein